MTDETRLSIQIFFDRGECLNFLRILGVKCLTTAMLNSGEGLYPRPTTLRFKFCSAMLGALSSARHVLVCNTHGHVLLKSVLLTPPSFAGTVPH